MLTVLRNTACATRRTAPALLQATRSFASVSEPVVDAAPKPAVKPDCVNFSSGPCAKRPGYDLAESLGDAALGDASSTFASNLC